MLVSTSDEDSSAYLSAGSSVKGAISLAGSSAKGVVPTLALSTETWKVGLCPLLSKSKILKSAQDQSKGERSFTRLIYVKKDASSFCDDHFA